MDFRLGVQTACWFTMLQSWVCELHAVAQSLKMIRSNGSDDKRLISIVNYPQCLRLKEQYISYLLTVCSFDICWTITVL